MAADDPLIARVWQSVAERGLLTQGDRVLVAVSGGPDSLVLLHALHALRSELQIELVAAHLHHGMRGEAADADVAFVRETARAWGIPVAIGRRDVPVLARRTGLSLEEAGRAARYRFFVRAARQAGCRRIATGHTADDQAETVLLHLLRGTGLDGLAGIPARRPLRPDRPHPEVVRPLLDVTRAQVLAYAARHGLQPRHDTTNDSPAFLRNRVRHHLLPLLEAEYAPAIRRHLLNLADLTEAEVALLDAQARELLRAALGARASRPHELAGGTPALPGLPALHLSRAVLQEAAPALARRALRLAVQSLRPGPPPERAILECLLDLLHGARPGLTLPGGRFAARVTDAALILEPADRVWPFEPAGAVPLAVPGPTPVPWAPGFLTAEVLGVDGWEWTAEGRPRSRVPVLTEHALLDLARVTGPLTVRPPRPGDRIQPLGMAGRRKLQDLLTDRKVPRALRRRLPVVADAQQLLWVAGCCVSEAARVTAQTAAVLLLRWERGG